MLIDSSFHDFELTIPVIGELPPSLIRDESPDELAFTSPTKIIAITHHEVLQSEVICSATLGTEGDLVVYSLVTQPGDNPLSGSGVQPPPEEPGSTLESEINQQLAKADALMTDDQRWASEVVPAHFLKRPS